MREFNWGTTLAFAGLITVFKTDMAHAYLDPGSASLILQAIVGAIGAGLVAGGIYWRKFTGLFKRNSADAAAEEDADRPLPASHDRPA